MHEIGFVGKSHFFLVLEYHLLEWYMISYNLGNAIYFSVLEKDI